MKIFNLYCCRMLSWVRITSIFPEILILQKSIFFSHQIIFFSLIFFSLGVISVSVSVRINVVHMNRLWNYNQSITLNHRKSDLLLQCIKPMKLLNWKVYLVGVYDRAESHLRFFIAWILLNIEDIYTRFQFHI